MSDKTKDKFTVRDATGRRTFIRNGAVFLMGTSAITSSMKVLADDCDQGGTSLSQKQATPGSDSDSGAGADPAGCGRKKDEVPAKFVKEDGNTIEVPRITSIVDRGEL